MTMQTRKDRRSTVQFALMAALALGTAPAHALYTVNFKDTNAADIVAGQVIDDEYAAPNTIVGSSTSVEISTKNNSGPDLGVAFDPGNPTGGDSDLGSPFGNPQLINASGGGDGDRVAATGAAKAELENPTGNLLVIQERNTGGACDDGFCLPDVAPDDDTQGGYHLFTFSRPETLLSVDIFDLDGGSQNESASIQLFGDTAMNDLLWELPAVTWFGNNNAARVLFGNDGTGVSDVVVAKLGLSSSGAFSNLRGQSTSVPEPASLGLVMLGLAALWRRRPASVR